MSPTDLYQKLFADSEYARFDYEPRSEFRYQYAVNAIARWQVTSVLDVGSGLGHLASMLMAQGLKVETADLKKFHDIDVPHHNIDLLNGLGDLRFDCITCLDVLEHLPENSIKGVIESISRACQFAVFTVANHSDIWEGEELHLIQRPRLWWDNVITQYFTVVSSEDHYTGRLYAYQLEGIFRSSSMVESATVNRVVPGPNPGVGAWRNK